MRDSGPGCDHHFTAWCPWQLPSILPACAGSPPGSQIAHVALPQHLLPPPLQTGQHLTGRAVAGQAFAGRCVNERAASLTVRLAPPALSSDEVEKQPRNRRAVMRPCVNTAFHLPNLLRFGHVGRSFPLKDKRNPLLGHYLQLMAGLWWKSQISARVKNIRDNSGYSLSYLSHPNKSNFCWASATKDLFLAVRLKAASNVLFKTCFSKAKFR